MALIFCILLFLLFCMFAIFKRFGKSEAIKYTVLIVASTLLFAIAYHYNKMPWVIGTMLVWVAIIWVMIRKALNYSEHGDKRVTRGITLLNNDQMQKILNQYQLRIPLGSYKLPINAEVKHCFIIGRPGTGKTNCLNQIIAEIGYSNLPAIIHDSKGDFVPKFYNDKTDHILNPLDERCVGWNIFNDIERETDFNLIACSLIPETVKSEPYWYEVPRKILAEVLSYCWHNNKRSNKDLWQVLSLPINQLADLLKESGGTSYNDLIGNEKTASNMMSILLSKCKVFHYLQVIDGDFSIKKWINQGQGFIFLTNQADIQDTVKPLLTLFIDVCASRLLSLPDDRNRRIFFILDEFGALTRINNIVNLLTLSRSKGGAVFIGIQDIGNIERLYGRELRQTIVNACGNSLIFAVEDPDTAEFLSKKIGDVEYYEKMESQSENSQGFTRSSGTSMQEQKRIERIVLASQIQQLQDGIAYIRIADVGTSMTGFRYLDWETYSPGFIEHHKLKLTPTARDSAVLDLEQWQPSETQTETTFADAGDFASENERLDPRESKAHQAT